MYFVPSRPLRADFRYKPKGIGELVERPGTTVDLEMRDSNPLSISIIQAISERENKDPNDLEYTLNDHIDPDVLDRLQSNGPRKWTLDFLLDSHHVTVNQDGQITVDGKTMFDRR